MGRQSLTEFIDSLVKSFPETVSSTSYALSRLSMYPFFEAAHAMYCITLLRHQLKARYGVDDRGYAKRHPFACWLSTMVMCFGPKFLANALAGESLTGLFRNPDLTLLYSAIWYLSFYSFGDIVFKLASRLPFFLAIGVMKEIYRGRRIYECIGHIYKAHSSQYFFVGLVATCKGAGELFMADLVVPHILGLEGRYSPFVSVKLSTRMSVLASAVYVVEKTGHLSSWVGQRVPFNQLHLAVVSFLVYFRLTEICINGTDPFIAFERLIKFIFFGGSFIDDNNSGNSAKTDRGTQDLHDYY